MTDLMRLCREATEGLYCDSRDLAAFLIRAGDPDWCRPEPARWWALHFHKHGGFPE